MVLNILGALVLGSVTSGHLPLGNSSNEKHREKVSSDKEALKQSPVLKVKQSMEQQGEEKALEDKPFRGNKRSSGGMKKESSSQRE